jgi:hypothetical protein
MMEWTKKIGQQEVEEGEQAETGGPCRQRTGLRLFRMRITQRSPFSTEIREWATGRGIISRAEV